MLQRLVDALVRSSNEAADEVLLEALRIGNTAEQINALDALVRRETVYGLTGVILQFHRLSEPVRLHVLKHIRFFSNALRECGRSPDAEARISAMRLIAMGRLGRLSYVLSDNLHSHDERLSQCAAEALVGLARWINTETRALVRLPSAERVTACRELIDNRPEIEQTVARALNAHRGRHVPELLRAGLLLSDWAGSQVLAILRTPKHGGQNALFRRLQQAPASEHTEAFLLSGAHGGLRIHFPNAFAQISEGPVLDAMLRKTHWLRNHQLHLCMSQVTRGYWLGETELMKDAGRHDARDAARIGAWVAASGADDALKDNLLLKLLPALSQSREARLDLLRLAIRRPRGASTRLLQAMIHDPDETIARLAVRDLIRHRSPEVDSLLLQRMATAPDAMRRIIARVIGQSGFDQYWDRFDRLDRTTRRSAGRAMVKLFPDAANRLMRRVASGSVGDRVKAMQIAHELELAETLRPVLLQASADASPKVRSKAVQVLGQLSQFPSDTLMDRVLTDPDARVRANAIEVLETRESKQYIPMLTDRARQATHRERANAIKALHKMRVGMAAGQLMAMLKDKRAEHRISALWALRQIGIWQMINEVANMARQDGDMKVRRYALGVLRTVASAAKERKKGSA